MELGGGTRDGGFGGIRGVAVPVGDDAAGSADDRDECGDVPRVHDRVEHDVGEAGGDEEIAVGVTPRADEFGALRESVVARGGLRLITRGIERIAGEERGVFDASGGAAADRFVVERGGDVVADDELVEDRLVNHAEDWLAAMKEGDEGREKRDAGDEGFGAVDGVEDPDEFGVGAIAAEFFANDAVGGKRFGDETAEKFLGAAVGGGDGRGVGFRFDREGEIAEVRTDEGAAFGGELRGEGAKRRQVHGVVEAAKRGEHTKNVSGWRERWAAGLPESGATRTELDFEGEACWLASDVVD